MHRAAEKSRIDVMTLLLEHGADVNQQLWETDAYKSSLARTKVKTSFGNTSDVLAGRHKKWSHEPPLHMTVLYR
jgi:ankyrin repeat protein